MNTRSLNTAFRLSVSRYVFLTVPAISALILTAGWLLWPSGTAEAQSDELMVSCTATMNPGNPTTEDDVAITGLGLPRGSTISPRFQSDTYSYAMTVPRPIEQLNISCRFVPAYGDYEIKFWSHRGRDQG